MPRRLVFLTLLAVAVALGPLAATAQDARRPLTRKLTQTPNGRIGDNWLTRPNGRIGDNWSTKSTFEPDIVSVSGYFKGNGTYVQPHWRTHANETKLDNWSTKGNTNPFTGKPGTRKP